MQSNIWTKLAISFVLALGVVKFYVHGLEDRIAQQYALVNAVCAGRDIPAGTLLQPSDLSENPIAARFLQPTGFVSKYPKEGMSAVIGKTTRIAIPSGAQILGSMIGLADVKTLDFVIPPGKRAYPLVMNRSEITRLIRAGSHIDIIANLSIRRADGSVTQIAKTVLDDIPVLSVRDELIHQVLPDDGRKQSSEGILLMLGVTAAQAETMSLAEKNSQGDFRIVIRSALESRDS